MVTEKEAKKNRDSAIGKGIPVEKEKKLIFLRHCNKTGNTFFCREAYSRIFSDAFGDTHIARKHIIEHAVVEVINAILVFI